MIAIEVLEMKETSNLMACRDKASTDPSTVIWQPDCVANSTQEPPFNIPASIYLK